jgi:hypothetical protein
MDNLKEANKALNRMRRANERMTGCRLTPEMIAGLAITSIGQMWEELDPTHSSEGNRHAD